MKLPSTLAVFLEKEWVINLIAFFTTIATILGTGILALPLTLTESGFTPFFISYTATFLIQALVITYFGELLQHAAVASGYMNTLKEEFSDPNSIDMSLVSSSTTSSSSSPTTTTTATTTPSESDDEDILSKGPDLHLIGKLYLSHRLHQVFNICVFIHFISILISYVLAGAEAYAILFHISYIWLIFPFWGILTFLIIFGQKIVVPLVSVFTALKGTLLVVLVLLTAVVSSHLNAQPKENWSAILQPILIGTVALGGATSTMPIIFSRVHARRPKSIRNFIMSCVGGLFAVFILNIAWCYYLLKAVPQCKSARPDGISLEKASEDGEISTVPLVEIIESDLPKYQWAAIVVDLFIIISITVSFTTMGTGFKHVLDGILSEWRSKHSQIHAEPIEIIDQDVIDESSETQLEDISLEPINESPFSEAPTEMEQVSAPSQSIHQPPSNHSPGWLNFQLHRMFKSLSLWFSKQSNVHQVAIWNGLPFSIIFLIAISNPSAFLIVLETVTSFAINLGLAALPTYAFIQVRKEPHVPIPYSIPPFLSRLSWLPVIYSLSACILDFVEVVVRIFS